MTDKFIKAKLIYEITNACSSSLRFAHSFMRTYTERSSGGVVVKFLAC